VRAEEIESQVWDRILDEREYDRDLPDLVDALIRMRGSEDTDVLDDAIWPLSLKIHVLLARHDIEAAREAAALGERRLALRRAALAAHPDELAHSLRELAALYSFELESFSPERARSLEYEAAAIESGGGEAHGG
jgi:hypothetical protein